MILETIKIRYLRWDPPIVSSTLLIIIDCHVLM